jgi:hypothetical protein
MLEKNIYDYIVTKKKEYENPIGIELEDGWNWSMKDHLKRSYLYLNSQFYEQNENRVLRPFKNIILPMMNIQYRLEGFDVKDIDLYVDSADEYHKSLLVRKFHTDWALSNSIDTFIDEMVESYCNYGGVLVRKRVKQAKPEVIDLRTIAFCDQVDFLSNPFAIRHEFSASQLRSENDKWGDAKAGADMDIETLISKSKKEGKSKIEIFEVHGVMPSEWLDGRETNDFSHTKDVCQMQIVSFYQDDNKDTKGVCLFKKQYTEINDFFKFFKRDNVSGRNLGRGGIEELFEPQQWTNQYEINIAEMLDGASKTLFSSDDPQFKAKNNLKDVKNMTVFALQANAKLGQIDTFPRNINLFNDAVDRFWQYTQTVSAGPDPLLGESPNSGTPFKLYEAQQIEGKGLHKYRQGKLATFMDEIYRDWILPHLAREICNEQKFMAELSAEEMEYVVDRVIVKKSNDFKKRMILSGQDINEELVSMYQDTVRKDFVKEGSKRFFEVLKDEFKDIPLKVMTNIVGKQKNLSLITDKLVNVIRQVLATPQILQDPNLLKLFNSILENSGLDPIMPSASQVAPAQQQMAANTQGLQQMGGQTNQQV